MLTLRKLQSTYNVFPLHVFSYFQFSLIFFFFFFLGVRREKICHNDSISADAANFTATFPWCTLFVILINGFDKDEQPSRSINSLRFRFVSGSRNMWNIRFLQQNIPISHDSYCLKWFFYAECPYYPNN